MSFLRSYKSWVYIINVYSCDKCNCEIDESFPMVIDKEKHYCIECAFRLGMIDEVHYCNNNSGSMAWMMAAGINPFTKEIEMVKGTTKSILINNHYEDIRDNRSKFTWEMNVDEARKSWQYKKFRKDAISPN